DNARTGRANSVSSRWPPSSSSVQVKRVLCISRDVAPGVLPAVAIATDVPQTNARIGDHLEAEPPRALAEREVFAQIPMPLFVGDAHREEERNNRPTEACIAHGQ